MLAEIKKLTKALEYARDIDFLNTAKVALKVYMSPMFGDYCEQVAEFNERFRVVGAPKEEVDVNFEFLSDNRVRVKGKVTPNSKYYSYLLIIDDEEIAFHDAPAFILPIKDFPDYNKAWILPVLKGEIGQLMQTQKEPLESGETKIFSTVYPQICKYQLLEDNKVIATSTKPEFYLVENESAKYFIRPVQDDEGMELQLFLAKSLGIQSDLTSLTSISSSALQTIYRYFSLISRSVIVLKDWNAPSYNNLMKYYLKKRKKPADSLFDLSCLLLDYKRIV